MLLSGTQTIRARSHTPIHQTRRWQTRHSTLWKTTRATRIEQWSADFFLCLVSSFFLLFWFRECVLVLRSRTTHARYKTISILINHTMLGRTRESAKNCRHRREFYTCGVRVQETFARFVHTHAEIKSNGSMCRSFTVTCTCLRNVLLNKLFLLQLTYQELQSFFFRLSPSRPLSCLRRR